MTPFKPALVLLAFVAVSGCGGSSESGAPGERSGAPGGTPATADRDASPSVDAAVIESCAGFTVQTAAELLGVPAGELEVTTRHSEELGGQMCRYWSEESLIGPGLQFLLEVESSSADAAARLRRLRDDAPAGDAAIRSATGQSERGRSVIAFEDIGDEAFWDPLTGGVNVRVGNIVASIQASTSRKSASDSDPSQVELERRVAERIASGLVSR